MRSVYAKRGSGASGGTPRSGLRRTAGTGLLLGLMVVIAGCATKRDLQRLQSEVGSLRERQDSIFLLLQRQNLAMIDTLNANRELLLRVRGDLGHQLIEMEQQLIQIQELTGQGQRRIAELREQMERRSAELAEEPAAEEPAPQASGPDPEQLYAVGVQQLRRGAATTARRAFEELLDVAPNHPRAADAQFFLAETYAQEEAFDRAVREFERVVELYPTAPRAATALYRAGILSEERGNISAAREYFERVLSGYPDSDEARLAAERVRRLSQ